MEYSNRLYVVLYPNVALIGSQLGPEDFAKHYSIGPTRYYFGKVIFGEIDPEFRHPFFDIESVLPELKPHEDGQPKATKFISSYRVLEHIDLDAVRMLYLATHEGYVQPLAPAPYETPEEAGTVRIFAEIAPIRMMVLADYDFEEFAGHVTDPKYRKGAPTMFYTQLDVDIENFIRELDDNPFLQSPVLSIHPSSLRDAFFELKKYPDKHTKGLSVDSSMDAISYKQIRNGFMFASHGKTRFFPMPTLRELEDNNYRFWKSL
ncbi:MAG: hypothetical protein R6W94_14635 [Spirochaetia bacterium]